MITQQKTLIVMALQAESQGLLEDLGCTVGYTGVGLIRAAQKTTELIEKYKPEVVLNLGTAGSFSWAVGELVEVSAYVHRGIFFENLYAPLTGKTFSSLPKVICGSADHVALSTQDLPVACDVMDMEAYAIAYVAKQKNIPFYSVKYISDRSGKDVRNEWKKNVQRASEAFVEFLKN